jgi:hypothetical protein
VAGFYRVSDWALRFGELLDDQPDGQCQFAGVAIRVAPVLAFGPSAINPDLGERREQYAGDDSTCTDG